MWFFYMCEIASIIFPYRMLNRIKMPLSGFDAHHTAHIQLSQLFLYLYWQYSILDQRQSV